jgi:hypothetical protein
LPLQDAEVDKLYSSSPPETDLAGTFELESPMLESGKVFFFRDEIWTSLTLLVCRRIMLKKIQQRKIKYVSSPSLTPTDLFSRKQIIKIIRSSQRREEPKNSFSK